MKIFADDTKLFRAIENIGDFNELQNDLNKLHELSSRWQLPFNVDKCKVVHYGSRNSKYVYSMDGSIISEGQLEKDLGVIFDPKLRFSDHVNVITAKANSRVAILKRTFKTMTAELFIPLYKSVVRPILEYCSCVWSPLLKRDKIEIEKVQRRATKLVNQFKHLEYSERLHRLNLESLNFRRKRADMIQTFKLVRGFENVHPEQFFTFCSFDRTRGHRFKIYKTNVNSIARANFFSQRVINDWNSLSSSTVEASTINGFKTALKREWIHHPERFDMP